MIAAFIFLLLLLYIAAYAVRHATPQQILAFAFGFMLCFALMRTGAKKDFAQENTPNELQTLNNQQNKK